MSAGLQISPTVCDPPSIYIVSFHLRHIYLLQQEKNLSNDLQCLLIIATVTVSVLD